MQALKIAQKGERLAVAKMADQQLGGEVDAKLAEAAHEFRTLLHIGDEPAAGRGPLVRQAVIDPGFLPQDVRDEPPRTLPREPDEKFAVLGKPQLRTKAADREGRGASHRPASRLDRDEAGDERPFESRRRELHGGDARLPRHAPTALPPPRQNPAKIRLRRQPPQPPSHAPP